jgi:CubicO group peptidase (beta-lactamase class C family)
MKKFMLWLSLTLLVMLVWAGLNVASTRHGWFSAVVAPVGDAAAFMAEATRLVKLEAKGNGIFMLVEGGEVYAEYAYSKGAPVNSNTVFGVASLGKWLAAVGVMTLVERGKLDLDAPVSSYLTRWQLPASAYDLDGVTIRRLLSHTAGLTDGLGHNGFVAKDAVQPLTAHLSQAADADEGVSGRVEVGLAPGSQFKYSGGGYNLLQLVIEEVSGQSFAAYMQEAVFEPAGMGHTGYDPDEAALAGTLAEYFDADGASRTYPYYTSLAATGLYTTGNDLLRFMATQLSDQLAAGSQTKILAAATLAQMRRPNASTMGIDIWGLGVMLFASNNAGDFIVGHGGQSPSLNATLRINPANGNGFLMLTTGNRALAADMATRWTLWETGNPDMYMLRNMIPAMLQRVALGSLLIVVLSLLLAWRSRRSGKWPVRE